MSSTTRRRTGFMTFDRADHAATRFLLWFVALGAALVTVVRPLVRWAGGAPVTGQITLDPELVPDPLLPSDQARVTWTGDAFVEIADPSATERLAALLPGLVLAAAVLVLAALLHRLLNALRAGAPFSQTSVRCLRQIAGVLTLVMVLMPLATALKQAVFARAADDSGSAFLVLQPLTWLTLGIAVLIAAAVAQAFAHGADLERDAEGIV